MNWKSLESDEEVQFVLERLNAPEAKRRKSGAIYIKCMFHDEKTPSLVYRPWTRRWHCYGCHRHGEIPEGISAPTALEGQLAFEFEDK